METTLRDPTVRATGYRAYCLFGVAALVTLWAGLFWWPDDRRMRFAATADTDYIKAGWIYQRLHDDPTPVDIAFLGSSRTMQGIDSGRIESIVSTAHGTPVHVVNLATPAQGNDLPYLLGRELLATKRPRLIFIEVDYIDPPTPNPGFALVAGPDDIVEAPLFFDQRLFSNLIYLPVRRLELFWHSLTEARAEPALAQGVHWDDTYRTTNHDGMISEPRLDFEPPAMFATEAAGFVRAVTTKASEYRSWAWLELRYNEMFRQRLVALAHAHGAEVIFFYMPAVGAPPLPFHADALKADGSIWTLPPGVTGDERLWSNPTHLNAYGASALSDWVGHRLASSLGGG